MGALLMFNNLLIKSNISGTYSVDFISDLGFHIRLIDEKSIFIIDRKVFEIYSRELNINKSRVVIIDSGEKNKTIEYCQVVIRKLIDLGVRKDDKLIAIGGGITQDIVAFISSILLVIMVKRNGSNFMILIIYK